MLSGQVALVTGASRGIGRGIALQLGEAGATVYITGRQPQNSDNKSGTVQELPTLEKTANDVTDRGGKGIAVFCDHGNDEDIKRLFDRISTEQNGTLDILVNNAYSAVNLLTQTGDKKFWELEPDVWDQVNNVGLRNHYICSVYAARMMVPKKNGLIVTVSSAGGLRYLFNVAYGVGKEACDRLACDMAFELRKHNVCSISLWPGAVRTEMIEKNVLTREDGGQGLAALKQMFIEGETIEFSGKCIAALAADKNRMAKTGMIHVTGDMGHTYGLKDIDGRQVPTIRSVKHLMGMSGYTGAAAWIPAWLRLPGWVLTAQSSKL